MKCPLLKNDLFIDGEWFSRKASDCLKEECAWWSVEMNQCDPTGLLPWFLKLMGVLQDMVDKMPSPEFFKK